MPRERLKEIHKQVGGGSRVGEAEKTKDRRYEEKEEEEEDVC